MHHYWDRAVKLVQIGFALSLGFPASAQEVPGSIRSMTGTSCGMLTTSQLQKIRGVGFELTSERRNTITVMLRAFLDHEGAPLESPHVRVANGMVEANVINI